ncbi:MAG: IS607 family transposase [Trichodesmium sp. St18_bin1]|jgi:DNA binding domain, excisionase family|nr:IS607 family transposase [Trichodesmium sp. St18_bin1]MDE5123958.1 IS607 family transposase [Trichodesmium sp. St19_bin1]
MSSLLSIQEAADLLGVSSNTLRRWEAQGKITSERTVGGHRRYQVSDLLNQKSDASLTIAYARVSSCDQKTELERQILMLEVYCTNRGWSYEIISDLGSGINYRKKGLVKLLKLITTYQVERLVLSHKDQLLRLGSDLIFSLCEQFGVEVVIINNSENSTVEEDLATDLLEIIKVFSARLYGSRNDKNKEIVQELKNVASKL